MSVNPKVFDLVVHPTYYDQGFFNVRVAFDRLVRQTAGDVQLLLGDASQPISAYVNRTANANGTARIMGGVALRDWFRTHCEVGQTVYVDLSTPSRLAIKTRRP